MVKAVQVTSRFPSAHGAPLHVGDPEALGIRDLAAPDYGDPPVILEGETPLFWACGVTPQAVAVASKPPFMITHAPRAHVHHGPAGRGRGGALMATIEDIILRYDKRGMTPLRPPPA